MQKVIEGINVVIVLAQLLIVFFTLVDLYVTIEPHMFALPALTIFVEGVLLFLLIGLSILVSREQQQLLASLRMTWAVTVVACVLIVLDVVHIRGLIRQ